MDGSPDVRVQIKYPHSGFCQNPKDKGFGFFPMVPTILE